MNFTKDDNWISLNQSIDSDIQLLKEIESYDIPRVGEAIAETKEKLSQAEKKLLEKQLIGTKLLEELEVEKANYAGIDKRLLALNQDLEHYKDVKKLRNLGSTQELSFVSGFCPTCQQQITDTLLPQDTMKNPMSIDENISFLEEQKQTMILIRNNITQSIKTKERQLAIIRTQMDEIRNQIRSLRKTLISDERIPSVAAVEEKVRIQDRIIQQKRVLDDFEGQLCKLAELAFNWNSIQGKLKKCQLG